jgi:chromosome segregation ATPase
VEGLQGQLQIIRRDRDGVAGQLAALGQTTDNLLRDLAESKANEIEAQTDAARNKEKFDKLRTSHETIQKQAHAEIETLQKQLSNMQCMNEKTLLDLAASERDKEEALKNVHRSQDELDKLEAKIDQLTSKLKISEMDEMKARSVIDKLLVQLGTFKQNNNKISKDLEYLESQQVVAQAHLKRQQEDATVIAKQLETSRDTENNTRHKLSAVENELSRAKLETRNLDTQITSCRNTIEASNQFYNFISCRFCTCFAFNKSRPQLVR